MEAIALKIARSYFGSSALYAERIREGVMNFMFKIRSESEYLSIVRIYPPGREKVARYEPSLLRQLRELGCQVPEVLEFNAGAIEELPCYLMYRYIDGQTLEQRRHQMGNRELERLASMLVE